MASQITLEEALAHYGEVLDKDTIRDIHGDARGVRTEVCEQLTMLTGIPAPATTTKKEESPPPAAKKNEESPAAAAADPNQISLDECYAHYGEFLDQDTIKGIHSEARGNRREVCDQLTMLTGISPPGVPKAGGAASAAGGDDSSGMGSRQATTMSEPMATGMSDYGVDMSVYDDALATGADKAKIERDKELNELMKKKVEDVAKLFERDKAFDEMVAKQRKAGPQSMRGNKINLKQYGDAHAHKCFEEMIEREREHCGEFVCFYHSYSYAALLYEIQCCIGRVLYGLPDDFGPQARLGKKHFKNRKHMKLLLEDFSKLQGQDHDPNFRAVAISCSVSLESSASEAPPMSVFQQGYSCNDLDFHGVMKNIFKEQMGYDGKDLSDMINACAAVGERHSLGGSYKSGGNAGQSHSVTNPGHMLQIFIRTDCVDDIAYGSRAYGVYEAGLNPPSEYLTKTGSAPNGQARIFWHPALFLDPSKTKVYHYAGNPGAHGANRLKMQKELEKALAPCLGTPEKALKAYLGMEGLLKEQQ